MSYQPPFGVGKRVSARSAAREPVEGVDENFLIIASAVERTKTRDLGDLDSDPESASLQLRVWAGSLISLGSYAFTFQMVQH